MQTKQKIKFLSLIFLAMAAIANTATASEVTGTLSTGISSPGVVGVVISPPIASPTAGSYTSAQTVTLTASGALNVHYTVNGVLPTCSTGVVYADPISVDSSLTIHAISCYPNSQTSGVASYAYTINIPSVSSFSASSGGGGGGGSSRFRNNVTNLSLPATGGSVLGASTGFHFDRILKLGMSGEDVKELQKRLTEEGIYKGPITGYFGPLTVAGVKAFQLKYDIVQTGVVGPITLVKLNEGSAGAVLGAQAPMTLEQMKTLIAELQAKLAALLAKQKAMLSAN